MFDLNRRDALKMSASFAVAAAAGGFSCVEMAKAAPIEVPTIDKLSVRVLVDSASDIFFKPQETNGVKTEPGRPADFYPSASQRMGAFVAAGAAARK
jgi:7,8-dihydropterin-6-yl-methyl-4-(beta-D-ribofuranosyl)aminobenzene 5'-phosphate synthase